MIVGGLKSPTTFLPAMLAARPQLRGHIDGVAIHPYGNPLVVLSKIRAARATIESLGLGPVPLYVTEFGWTTSPPAAIGYAPAAKRPGYVASTVAALGHLDCGVAAAVLYTWVSPGRNPSDSQDWYGIDGLDGAATPSVAAFEDGLRRPAGPRACGSGCARHDRSIAAICAANRRRRGYFARLAQRVARDPLSLHFSSASAA